MPGLRPDAKTRLLGEVSLFDGSSHRELAAIAAITTALTVSAGTVLCQQGAPGEEFFVLVSGEVQVELDGEQVAVLGAGSFVGEMALLDDGPRTATVTARTETDLLVLNRREFRTLLVDFPTVGVRVLTELAGRLRANAGRLPRQDGVPTGT